MGRIVGWEAPSAVHAIMLLAAAATLRQLAGVVDTPRHMCAVALQR
jgi:hypothetical protein